MDNKKAKSNRKDNRRMKYYFDDYPEFYRRPATQASPLRMHYRQKAIIKHNAHLFKNAKILDLGCHDGRWCFASLKAGASHVTGVDFQPSLITAANSRFEHYGVDKDKYTFICDDFFHFLETFSFKYDLILCLGILYHIIDIGRLIGLMRETGAKYIIIETSISAITATVLQLSTDKNGIGYGIPAYRDRSLVALPSKKAIEFILKFYEFDWEYYNWHKKIKDWTGLTSKNGLKWYKMNRRILLVAARQ